MYFEIVRKVLDESIEAYAAKTGLTVQDVLGQARGHVNRTQRQHRCDEADIDYNDPLCRLGYLQRHAAANATLFEKALLGTPELGQKICRAAGGVLRVCAVGGGPGTELLGLAKYLRHRPRSMPRRIAFTVLDKVPHWGETWQLLADTVEIFLRSATTNGGAELPAIAPMFYPLDVLDAGSYRDYAVLFRSVDVVVFNYLFSENKTRLDAAKEAVRHLAAACPAGCVFVVIDRLENNPAFGERVREMFEEVFRSRVAVQHFDGTLDSDEQTSEMGEMLIHALGFPRVKFFTPGHRSPTVFWFTVARVEGAQRDGCVDDHLGEL